MIHFEPSEIYGEKVVDPGGIAWITVNIASSDNIIQAPIQILKPSQPVIDQIDNAHYNSEK
jgi:hypothetical protein